MNWFRQSLGEPAEGRIDIVSTVSRSRLWYRQSESFKKLANAVLYKHDYNAGMFVVNAHSRSHRMTWRKTEFSFGPIGFVVARENECVAPEKGNLKTKKTTVNETVN